MNNLYIIEEVLVYYTAGMAVIAAPTLERCREIFAEEYVPVFPACMIEYDEAILHEDYTVIEAVNHPAGIVAHVVGGG